MAVPPPPSRNSHLSTMATFCLLMAPYSMKMIWTGEVNLKLAETIPESSIIVSGKKEKTP